MNDFKNIGMTVVDELSKLSERADIIHIMVRSVWSVIFLAAGTRQYTTLARSSTIHAVGDGGTRLTKH